MRTELVFLLFLVTSVKSGSYGINVYNAKYAGHCEEDGIYYNNERSFITCSHSMAYIQPCAPGTRNSAASNFQRRAHYSYSAFCSVNLVDHGHVTHFFRNKARSDHTSLPDRYRSHSRRYTDHLTKHRSRSDGHDNYQKEHRERQTRRKHEDRKAYHSGHSAEYGSHLPGYRGRPHRSDTRRSRNGRRLEYSRKPRNSYHEQ